MADDIPADAVELTEGDLDALVTKLDAWAETLAPAERGLLQLLVARAEAGAAEGDVSGFGFSIAPISGISGVSAPGVAALPSFGGLVSNMLRPTLGSGSIFMGSNAGTWSSWGRR